MADLNLSKLLRSCRPLADFPGPCEMPSSSRRSGLSPGQGASCSSYTEEPEGMGT